MRLTIPELELLSKVLSDQAITENENQIYYQHLGSSLNTFAYHDPKQFPRLETLLPKHKCKLERVPPKHVQKAMETARALGHITDNF